MVSYKCIEKEIQYKNIENVFNSRLQHVSQAAACPGGMTQAASRTTQGRYQLKGSKSQPQELLTIRREFLYQLARQMPNLRSKDIVNPDSVAVVPAIQNRN